ncbi:MAG: HPF/RaiA family ribosome-associated protein [Saprospiraceae bacterium]
MNVNYHATFSINEYFKNQITEKVKRLDELNLRFSEADVYFKLKDGAELTSDKEFEIKIRVPGQVLFSKSHSDTFEKAIPLAFSKIRKQIIKYKQSMEPKRGERV